MHVHSHMSLGDITSNYLRPNSIKHLLIYTLLLFVKRVFCHYRDNWYVFLVAHLMLRMSQAHLVESFVTTLPHYCPMHGHWIVNSKRRWFIYIIVMFEFWNNRNVIIVFNFPKCETATKEIFCHIVYIRR